MADDMRDQVEAMVDVRVTSLRTQARREAITALFEEYGEVTEDAVTARMAAVFTPPDRATLLDQVARKCRSNVEERGEALTAAEGRAANARAKRDAALANVQAAEDEIAAADAALDAERAAHTDAVALADYASGAGDASADSPGRPMMATAGVATATTEGGPSTAAAEGGV